MKGDIKINKTKIKNSKYLGKGVFARSNIKNGEDLFVFSNEIIKIKHEPGCHCEICCRCIQIGESEWLYPKKESFGWYLNHSCEPNSGIIDKNIVSLQDIKEGEEITIDYSTTNVDKNWEMKCLCNSKNCRKIIRSVQFLPKDLFDKYKDVMPEFVKGSYQK